MDHFREASLSRTSTDNQKIQKITVGLQYIILGNTVTGVWSVNIRSSLNVWILLVIYQHCAATHNTLSSFV